MFSFKKTDRTFPELTSKEEYASMEIYEQLIEDSFYKCYLCGEKQEDNKDVEVEHFIPHESGKYLDLKYDWSNLLLSCGYCNSRKSSTYNKVGKGKDILNSVKDMIEDELLQYYDVDSMFKNRVEFENLSRSKKVENTIELLEKIYNEDLNSRETAIKGEKSWILREHIMDELYKFRKTINRLANNPKVPVKRKYICEALKNHLTNSSNFYEFKVGYVEKHPKVKELLKNNGII